jgi:hypothetical protein
MAWNVTLTTHGLRIFNHSTGSTIGFRSSGIPNTTYSYLIGTVNGFHTATYRGSITVGPGNSTNTTKVKFQQQEYWVELREKGLPIGSNWTGTIGSKSQNSTTRFFKVLEPNGTYSFTAGSSGYTASPANGTLKVAGASVTKAITFS